MLTIGGLDMRQQLDVLNRGVHMCIATPGRLNDMLNKNRFNLDLCKYICLDEADRLIGEQNFEEEVRLRIVSAPHRAPSPPRPTAPPPHRLLSPSPCHLFPPSRPTILLV